MTQTKKPNLNVEMFTSWKLLLKIWEFTNQYRIPFIAILLLSTVDAIFNFGIAIMQKHFIDNLVVHNYEEYLLSIKIFAFVLLILWILSILQFFLRNYYKVLISREISTKTFNKILKFSFSDIQKLNSGDIVVRIVTNVNQASEIISNQASSVIYNVSLCTAAFFYLANVNIILTIAVIFFTPISLILGKIFDKKIRNTSKDVQVKESIIRSDLQEVLQGLTVIKAYSLEKIALNKFNFNREKQILLHKKITILYSIMIQIIWNVNNAIRISISFIIAFAAIKGEVSVGTVLAFIMLIQRIQRPIMDLAQTWGGIQQNFGSSEKVFQLEENQVHITTPNYEEKLKKYVLSLKDITYSVTLTNGKQKNILENFTLNIQQGEIVAIVGYSGSGKTTLARLCSGLYHPSKGSIHIYGNSTQNNLNQLRTMVSYVPQNNYNFNTTIEENIYLGQDFNEGKLRSIAKNMLVDDFVKEMSLGYQSIISENGSNLSGGQKQKIGMARAFYKDTSIVVLDEPTSSLDYESESNLLLSLKRCLTSRTALIFSHNINTIRIANRIIVLNNGKIVEEGTHEDLKKRNGFYTKIISEDVN